MTTQPYILVVEDEEALATLLHYNLEKEGYRIELCADGEEAMIRIDCRSHHAPANRICPECRQLLDYASARLERCRFGAEKPTCANCPVHCYQRARRDQIKAVMRYSGPRMLWEHPILSLRHWLDGFRKAPEVRSPAYQNHVEKENGLRGGKAV